MHLNELASMKFLNIINVRVDKQGKAADYDPFEKAWEALIQRFENTLRYGNFPRPKFIFGDIGTIFCDAPPMKPRCAGFIGACALITRSQTCGRFSREVIASYH